jgi:hypothetical protein
MSQLTQLKDQGYLAIDLLCGCELTTLAKDEQYLTLCGSPRCLAREERWIAAKVFRYSGK